MADDPVLDRVKDALTAMYGEDVDRIVLFGSRARGDARGDSDYDVAVFLKTSADRRVETRRLADLRVELIDETGVFFDLLPFEAEAYEQRTPLMWDIRAQGRDLWASGDSRPADRATSRGAGRRLETASLSSGGDIMPETAFFLDKARRSLDDGRKMLGIALGEPAGRSAYLAAFHAAQALIFEREKRVVKTHNGVHAEFQRLVAHDASFPADLRGFVSRAFALEAIADYDVRPDATVSPERARDALDEAELFIAAVEAALAATPG